MRLRTMKGKNPRLQKSARLSEAGAPLLTGGANRFPPHPWGPGWHWPHQSPDQAPRPGERPVVIGEVLTARHVALDERGPRSAPVAR